MKAFNDYLEQATIFGRPSAVEEEDLMPADVAPVEKVSSSVAKKISTDIWTKIQNDKTIDQAIRNVVKQDRILINQGKLTADDLIIKLLKLTTMSASQARGEMKSFTKEIKQA
jgi:hypothetical protein